MSEDLEFTGNRNMLKYAMDTTPIPHELIYLTTGISKEQLDIWINDVEQKVPMPFSDLRKLCAALIMPSSMFFLSDENIPTEQDKYNTYNAHLIEGKHLLIKLETIRDIKNNVDEAMLSNDAIVWKLALAHVLRYLQPYTSYIDW